MSAQIKSSSKERSYWCLKLLALLQDMATQNTNAVQQLLADVDCLEVERRYPESGLLFAGRRWRAYYHCHETVFMHPNEHGHFHIFTDIGDQHWAHAAGLSIDAEGQPLQWFTVNRWVTDGPWLDSDVFLKQLKYITENNEEEGLVTSWLATLLALYNDTLFDLFNSRDEKIRHHSTGCSEVVTQENRDLYTLSTQSVHLQSKLEKHLLCDQGGVQG
jgi:hypothetical protein